MALTCPVGFDTTRLNREIESTYDRVARDPTSPFHFHRGVEYATNVLHYDRAELDALPTEATEAMAGVGNPLRMGRVDEGETVVDLGSGAGTDLLLAARRVGASGRAIGIDMTAAMRERAQRAVDAAGLSDRVELLAGTLLEVPVADATADLVISNGVLNLATDKRQAFAEAFRILRPGGRLMIADVTLATDLSEKARSDVELWAA